MKFIIKLFPEIILKSYPVRVRFIKILTTNIRNIFKQVNCPATVMRSWDHIEVQAKHESLSVTISDILTHIPGIHHVLSVEEYQYSDLNTVLERALIAYRDKLINKRFCVRVKRRGQHSFTSCDVERYLGTGLHQHISGTQVDLKQPQVRVNIEIDQDKFRIVTARYEGLCGFPIGTQQPVLSLISGGFDSSVSSYMLMRRGCQVHFCFFQLGGTTHELGVKEIAYSFWQRFGSSHKVRFITVDFAAVLNNILQNVENGQMGVVLKRMMIRAAAEIAMQYGVQALVTGEALGQVSSQTLTNLSLIDNATNTLILRPLIAHDKEQIIDIARTIGTEILSKNMPEFCSIISKNPTVNAIPSKIAAEEALLDVSILNHAVRNAKNIDIRQIAAAHDIHSTEVEMLSKFPEKAILLDIRAPEAQTKAPLRLDKIEVKKLPFYKLSTQFAHLDQSKMYLLYCDQGLMSCLQARHLHDQGFKNCKVYRPEKNGRYEK